jgi:hypothetical protein
MRRLAGGDGAAFAVVIQSLGGRLVSAALVHNAPGFDHALVTPLSADATVPAGRYTVALVGTAVSPVRLLGLAAAPALRTQAKTKLSLWRTQTSTTDPVSAWQEPVTFPPGSMAVAALVGDAGPLSGSAASTCLAPAADPTSCDQPDAVGATTDMSSPLPPPAPASSHAHYAWFRHDPAHLRGPRVFTGTAGAGTSTWHALFAVTR